MLDLAQKHKVVCNPPLIGQRRSRGSGASELKTVSPQDRVKEFPNECLTMAGKNFTLLRNPFGETELFTIIIKCYSIIGTALNGWSRWAWPNYRCSINM